MENKLKCLHSYDVIGEIAIVEIPNKSKGKERRIAENLLSLHKNIKTVCRKAGMHSGRYRTQKLRIIGGRKTKETIYKENNVQLKLNVEKVYFSPRLATERKRIAGLIKNGESVLVMFSGCGPYPIVIAKNSRAKEVYGIEINPIACKYAEENTKLNKINNIKLYCGDVKKIIPQLKKKFDRIVMPLPMGGENYLGLSLKKIKKNGTIHLYIFSKEDDLKRIPSLIKDICKKNKKRCRMQLVKCGQYAPRKYRMCADINIL